MGGAGAIGAFATASTGLGLDPVDIVTGPGNNFVAAAKRAVAGLVGTDAEAGATEILIVADATPTPRLVAADLISQAEHDEQAAAVLVTDSERLADAVAAEIGAPRGRDAPRGARRRGAGGTAVGDRPRRRPRRGDGVQQRVRARAPRAAPRRPAARAVRPRRRGVRRGRLAGEPRRLSRRQQPRPADRRAGALLRRGCRRRRSCVRSR